ncbi:MAG: lysylphosphatidylglycerol synthase transmembrane domain-containing protein [Chloroflexota bacterium]|nr:lysylphosphatidylglycerol synthase transmembrane domain-containing protein [Chloroflexota bacterium]
MKRILERLSFNTRWVRWAGTILSMGLFAWLLMQQDWRKVWSALHQVPLWLFPLTFGLYFCGVLANALRWYVLLRAQDVDLAYTETLKIVLSGNFASNFLPSTVGGDTVRIVSASRFAGWTVGIASVVVDRLLNVFVMAVLLPFSWFTFAGTLPLIRGSSSGFLAGSIFPAWAEKFWHKIIKLPKKVIAAFLVWRQHLDAVLYAVIISFAARFCVFLAIWFMASALEMSVTFGQVVGVGAITYVLSLLPISINGFGLREITMTALYAQLGASLEQASALVVVTRFILMLETLPGALWISDMLVAVEEDDDFELKNEVL